ncbi:hypothetical protein, partial [Limibacillus halophilus]
PMPPVAEAFETIGMAKVAKSAFEAKELGFLRASDGITFNRDRLLADAKAKALELAEGYQPPEPLELTLPGPAARRPWTSPCATWPPRASPRRTTRWWRANSPACSPAAPARTTPSPWAKSCS